MGDYEAMLVGIAESLVRYHSVKARILTFTRYPGREQFQVGSFDWGGRLPNGNGGAQRFSQTGWKSVVECKGIRELDCETYMSNRDESRP